MTANSSCRFLSNGYRFELKPSNQVFCTPCCKWDNGGPAILINSTKQQFTEYRNQIGNINSYSSDYCHQCNYLEDKGFLNTMRDSSFYDIPADAEFGDPSFLEIQVDRTCNGACVVCGPHFSSLWQQELRRVGNPVPDTPKLNFVSRILFLIDIQKTKKINFLGGESFLTDHDTQILHAIKHPEDVVLQYSTNGSIYPSKERQDLWKNFKRVNISFSIDGVGKQFDYIRYPLSWDQVSNNFYRMRESMPLNVHLSIGYTINILNLYYVDEYQAWCQQQGILSNQTVYNIAFGSLSPLHTTEKLYNLIKEKYFSDHVSYKAIKDANLNSTDLLNYLSEIDKRRGLDWRLVFPEIAQCF